MGNTNFQYMWQSCGADASPDIDAVGIRLPCGRITLEWLWSGGGFDAAELREWRRFDFWRKLAVFGDIWGIFQFLPASSKAPGRLENLLNSKNRENQNTGDEIYWFDRRNQ